MKIIAAWGGPAAVVVQLDTPEGRPFYMRVSADGLAFHSDRNSGGTLTDNPIIKSSEDVFTWIKNDVAAGGKKPFGDRVRLKPKA